MIDSKDILLIAAREFSAIPAILYFILQVVAGYKNGGVIHRIRNWTMLIAISYFLSMTASNINRIISIQGGDVREHWFDDINVFVAVVAVGLMWYGFYQFIKIKNHH